MLRLLQRVLHRPAAEPEQKPRVALIGPPGWYRDPEGSRRMRWYDGRFWTDRYRDLPSRGHPRT